MTKKVKFMEEQIEDIELDHLGFCAYCKDAVYAYDEHVIKHNGTTKIYHIECWEQKNNIKQEVDFDV